MEVQVRDYGLSPAQQNEIWRRWREGQSLYGAMVYGSWLRSVNVGLSPAWCTLPGPLAPGPSPARIAVFLSLAAADVLVIVLPVPPLNHLVQLAERGDLGDGNEADATEIADLAFDSALLSMPGRQ
ncbi:hypothetical protein AB0D04_36565 [Streptomyces sp. NPDC048483]|uniref:hypothetical protein n=1 Tax=Streptomyces sp. NPDC048483 TaxID=3154927 RepID=UPI00342CA328